MKILYKDKLYVQVSDLMFLFDNMNIPNFIFQKFYKYYMEDANEKLFIEFNDANEINFLQEIEWIINYNEVYNTDIITKMNELRNQRKHLTASLYCNPTELAIIDYKLKTYYDILCLKKGQINFSLPIIPNEKTYSIIDKTGTYEIRPSIDDKMLLLYRIDGNALSKDDRILPSFIQGAISIAIIELEEKKQFNGDFSIKKYLSDDNMYFIIEFKAQQNTYINKIKNVVRKLIK